MTGVLVIAMVVAMGHAVAAQDKMSKPMGNGKTYTGCLATGDMAGSYTLTNPMAEMPGDSMKKGSKDTEKKDGMAPASGMPTMNAPLALQSTTIDLSKHVGHKVSVTIPDNDMAMSKDAMNKAASASTVTSLKMLAATCGM